jgi:hypothetical protein
MSSPLFIMPGWRYLVLPIPLDINAKYLKAYAQVRMSEQKIDKNM